MAGPKSERGTPKSARISQQATNLNEEEKEMVYDIDWIEPVKTGIVWID
jgi:hypothetical protein